MSSPVAELLRDLAGALDGLALEWYRSGRRPPSCVEDVAAVLAAQYRSFDAAYARQTLHAIEEALGQSDLLPLFERLWSKTERT